MISIRDFVSEDYGEVVKLLVDCYVDPPIDESELAGLCLVAEDNGSIVGCIYALAGASSKAYVDFLAVREDYRGSICFALLLCEIEKKLKVNGVKRFVFNVEKYNHDVRAHLLKYMVRYRITKLRELDYFSKEIG